MTTLRERVAGERRRLKSVREALSAAVARTSGGDAAFVPFYGAVADYIEAAMARLHEQDVRMGVMLRASPESKDAAGQQALRELDERLAGNQAHLQAFIAAARQLAARGTAAVDDFERVSRAYTDFIVANMGHHGATTELAARVFSTTDWERMAHVSEADTRREEELYSAVFSRLPASLADLKPVA
ncbi:MAG: hypothetical protein KJ041_01710 [Gammaproteobacteria bacterium]|nr:hypothetical protein [Gammaproteobacteria bacterium]